MAKRGLGRDQIHDVAWGESYPHPMVSCMMPLVALLSLVAVVALGFQFWQWSLPRDTPIPPVEGLPVTEAKALLQRADLGVEVSKEEQTSEVVPAGAIISMDPPSGRRVKTGRMVRLIISAGSAYTSVPDVRELSQGTAVERLQKAGLRVSNEQYAFHQTIPFDRVIAIAPAPGTKLRRHSTVSLTISKGPQEAEAVSSTDLRSTVVTADLPTDAEGRQRTRIEVKDDEGTRVVYEEMREPGDTLIETVQGTGDMTIKVYFGNRLILTRKY